MLEALLDGKPIRASKELKGKHLVFRCKDEQCKYPELELVAGNFRRPHFRHKRRGNCTCSDGETDWHLEWKSHFEQIEVDMGIDKVTGERNRADAVVGNNFVIEFQHSSIKEDEQLARERFYSSIGGMIWIVDANKPGRIKAKERAIRDGELFLCREPELAGFWEMLYPGYMLGRSWETRDVGVVFDYGPNEDLLFVLPDDSNRKFNSICRYYKREELINKLKIDSSEFRRNASWHAGVYRMNKQRELDAARARRAAEEAAKRQKLKDDKEHRKQQFEEWRKVAAKRALEVQRTLSSRQMWFEQIGPYQDWVADCFGRVWQRQGQRMLPIRNIRF